MLISEAYPSKYLKAADLKGQEAVVTIEQVSKEEIDRDESKPVLRFKGKNRGLVLNVTNANNIVLMYGDDTETWVGKQVTLFTTFVDFQGRSVEAIRVKPVQPNSSLSPTSPLEHAPAGPHDPLDDEIPF